MNKKLVFIVILVASLFFRLWLTDKGWHIDMLSNAGWGEWIYDHGPAKFYDNSYWTYSWPTQPPVINSIYALNKKIYIESLGRMAWIEYQIKKYTHTPEIFWLSDFVSWFGYGKINIEIPFQIGYLVTMKIFPILADLLLGTIIFFVTGKKLKWAILYLISPFSWYLSALWGQYDQVGFFLALTAFLLVGRKAEFLAPGVITAAILIKPTSLILLPFFGYWYLRKGNKFDGVKIAGMILPVIFFWVTTSPYTYKNPLIFARYDLTRIIFEKSEPRVSVNAFNFWRILIGDNAKNQSWPFLFIPSSIWSLLAFAGLNLLSMIKAEAEKNNRQVLWECLFIVSAGSFLFMTGMLERYMFAGTVFGLLTVSQHPKLVKYWIIMSVIFWLNLFYHWWFPGFLSPLKEILLWQDSLITRFLALINTVLFTVMAVSFVRLPKWQPLHFQKLFFPPSAKRKAQV